VTLPRGSRIQISRSSRRRSILIGAALSFAACGDGVAIRLGGGGGGLSSDSGSDVSELPDGASPDDGGDAPSGSLCATGGESVPAAMVSGLLAELEGFGERTYGGRDGCLYRVVNANDDGPGSLRYGLEQPDASWIVFDGDFPIKLSRDIVPLSNKTVDGRGRTITIRDYGLAITNQNNVIIESVQFVGLQDGSGDSNRDAIRLDQASFNVWIDHCSFTSYEDGLVDVIEGATDVTISWSHFFDHNRVMLFGSTIDDTAAANMRVTLHHNWFDHTQTYQPRIRYGFVHMFNNFLDSWQDYGVAASQDSKLFSESNVFLAAGSDEGIITQAGSDDLTGNVRSENDLPLNGTVLVENNRDSVTPPTYRYTAERIDVDAGADGGADAATPVQTNVTAGIGPR
jgi:pectate lyase